MQNIVDDGGCGDEITLANIAVQALIGLAFLHSCGQLHRDLKPGNFLISHRGDVKVVTFLDLFFHLDMFFWLGLYINVGCVESRF